MEFSPRLRQILLIMLKREGIVSVKQLAEEIKVSKRTVQRELEYLESSLKKYDVSLNSKPGAGLWLAGGEEDLKRLYQALEKQDVVDSGDKENRRKGLVLELLKDRSPKKLYYYGNLFRVSEATISSDIESIQEWFGSFRLKIIRKPGYGVYLEGSEKNYRLAVREFLAENIDNKAIREMLLKNRLTLFDVLGSRQERSIYSLLNNEILEQVVTSILSIQDGRIRKMTENSYIGLIIHITIAVDRILKGEIIEGNQDILDKIIRDEDYSLARHIVSSLEEQFQIEVPDMETAYIYLHIKGSKHQQPDEYGGEMPSGEGKDEIGRLVDRMIVTYDESIAYQLKQDEDFLEGLAAHLEPTIIRFKNNMMITNPLLVQIQESYPGIFEKCRRVGSLLEEQFGVQVPDSEIGFLALHFGAAEVRLESRRETLRKVRIGIVCASGIGISRLMLAKLKHFIRERGELYAYGREDVTKEQLDKLDFLITSIPLEGVEADILMISPLLTEKDLELIDGKVWEYARTPLKDEDDGDFSRQLMSMNRLSEKIQGLIQGFFLMEAEDDIGFEDLVAAVAAAINRDRAGQRQIIRDIIRRERLASQIVPQFRFALFHTRTAGVDKPCFLVCVPKGRGAFTNPYFEEIYSVVVMLMPLDDELEENRDLLGHISGTLVDGKGFLGVIFDGDEERIRTCLEKELKRYFNYYLDKV